MDTQNLLERMRAAVLLGAALAAVAPGCKADPDPDPDGGAGGAGGHTGGHGGGASGGTPTGGMPAGGDPGYPLAMDPGPCPPEPDAGPDNPPLSGPCCARIECYEPPAGEACLLLPAEDYPAQDAVAGKLGHEGLGSGDCLCGVQGPWDAESAHAFTEATGRCCYTIAIMWCTGRPLVVAGVARVAPLVHRADWT